MRSVRPSGLKKFEQVSPDFESFLFLSILTGLVAKVSIICGQKLPVDADRYVCFGRKCSVDKIKELSWLNSANVRRIAVAEIQFFVF